MCLERQVGYFVRHSLSVAKEFEFNPEKKKKVSSSKKLNQDIIKFVCFEFLKRSNSKLVRMKKNMENNWSGER